MSRPRRGAGERSDLRSLTDEQSSELGMGRSILVDRAAYRRSLDGPVHFASEEERRAAWEIHGDRIMAEWDVPRRRPRGWWHCEAGEDPPASPLDEVVRLVFLGELTAREVERLPGSLTASARRELIGAGVLDALPRSVRDDVVRAPGLLSGLTPKGVEHFLGPLPDPLEIEVESYHGPGG